MVIHSIKSVGSLHSPYLNKEKGFEETSYHAIGGGFDFDSS